VSTMKIPEKNVLEKAFLLMLKETDRNPTRLRWRFCNISKYFQEWYGCDGAVAVLQMYDHLAIENGIDPADLLPRPSESREQLLVRIARIGPIETGIVRNASNSKERLNAIKLIEMQVLEHASEEDVLFVYDHLSKVFLDLDIHPGIEMLPAFK